MNGGSVLLDTNIVLYLLSGDKVLAELLFDKKLYLSFINQLELLGFKDITQDQYIEIQKFINECIVIDINEEIKNNVVGLRRTSKLKLPDSIVLATAQYLTIPFITSDVDFKSISSSEVIIYS